MKYTEESDSPRWEWHRGVKKTKFLQNLRSIKPTAESDSFVSFTPKSMIFKII